MQVDKYQNKYRQKPSLRANWWDYSWNGAYFITICTANRQHFFGKIVNGKMLLSPAGTIANVLWHELPNRNPHLELGDFVVMPNHIHGILILNKPVDLLHATDPTQGSLQGNENDENDENDRNEKMAAISPKAGSVSAIIRSYKSAVTKHANRLGLENGWQSRFHDRIIRNDAEYQRISDYIVANPENWTEDQFHSK